MVSRLFSSSAKPIKLYLDTLSQPCRALEIFLKINKIPYEPKVISLGKLEQRSDEFTKINPFQKVPAIDDNGFYLAESVAIFRHLCRHNKIADNWYPRDNHRRAAVDEYIEWQHLGLRLHCGMYVWTTFFTPNITGEQPKPEDVEEKKQLMENALDQINDIWLNNKPFVAGKEISFADILAACEIEELRLSHYDPNDGRPTLKDWLNRVRELTNPFYDEAHLKITKVAAKTKPK